MTRNEEATIAAAFSTPEGEGALTVLKSHVQFSASPFATDPQLTAYMCGQHDVVHVIVNALATSNREVDHAGFIRTEH